MQVSTIISPGPVDRKNPEDGSVRFSWAYVMLPGLILVLSIILAVAFLALLPSDTAYHFKDGLPDRWTSRVSIITWTIAPQFIFFLLALVVSSVILSLSRRFRRTEVKPVRKLISIMGNMIALPQIILTFAMLDIFLYNSYRIHLIPLWLFALIVMVAGGIIIGLFLIRAYRQFQGYSGKITGSDNNGGTVNR
jgi:uncharacterized membrane protein